MLSSFFLSDLFRHQQYAHSIIVNIHIFHVTFTKNRTTLSKKNLILQEIISLFAYIVFKDICGAFFTYYVPFKHNRRISMKKVISLLIATVLLTSLFVSCARTPTGATVSSDTAHRNIRTTSSDAETHAAQCSDTVSY